MDDDELHELRAHPGYEYAATAGPRKTWDDSEVPPDGEGWERNRTAVNPDGWERFDYHEASYWRRPRPGGTVAELPNLPWLVRDAKGKAIAAFADMGAADTHADSEPGWTVTYDHWAAQNPGPKRSPWAESGPTTDRSN